MKNTTVKYILFSTSCVFGDMEKNDGWHCEIRLLTDDNKKHTYRADLYGPNYDDFDWVYHDVELTDTSPEFATMQEAINYAEKTWVRPNGVIWTKQIDNCLLAKSNIKTEYYYQILYATDKTGSFYRSKYQANLYIKNDNNSEHHEAELLESSPEFDALYDALFYAQKEWINNKEEE